MSSETDIRTAILINSFNRLDLFREALKPLQQWLPSDPAWKRRVAVVVYDAGSTDGTLEWLEEQKQAASFPIEIVVPQSAEEDTSFAAGLNTIAAFAIERYKSLDYLLFYETDNQILSAPPLTKAREVLERHDKMAACGFTVRYVDGRPAGIGASFPTVWKFFLGPKLVHALKMDSIRYRNADAFTGVDYGILDIVHTSPLLVKVSAWLDSGGLDAERFPFSDCDLDWAKVLHDKGWLLSVIKTDEVIHDNQAAISSWSANRAIQSHQGRLRYLKKHARSKVFLAWPVGLLLRHGVEWMLANLIYLGKPDRRRQIRSTTGRLFRYCLSGYER